MAETDEGTEQKRVPLRFRIPTKMPSVVAQHLTVQPDGDGFLLSFYEVIPPLIHPDITTDQLKAFEESGVIAECVSKVYVPLSRYEDFIDAMESVLEAEDEEVKAEEGKAKNEKQGNDE
jgi:hypothetical protein